MTFQQGGNGYNGATDGRLQQNTATSNYGSAPYLSVKANSTHVSLVRFDLASLPPSAQIQSASLSLYLDNKSGSSNVTLNLFPLARPWTELQATWNRATSNQNWTQAGAGAVGSDYLASPLSSGPVQAAQAWYQFDVTAAVRQWAASPGTNYGLVLRGDGSSTVRYNFVSSNNSSVTLRPRLVITLAGSTTATPVPPVATATPTQTSVPPTATSTPTRTPIMPTATPTAISPTPTAIPPTPTALPGAPAWNSVSSWVYQLTDYQNNRLDQIAGSRFNLAVVDLARDGSSDYFTRSEIAAVQATGKIVLSYFEIGAIEDYRPEWPLVPADLKLGAVGGWPSEQYVKYWDARWWPIVQGRIDQAVAAGFDGAYLDMIVTYEEIPANAAGTSRDDLASKMVDLIERTSAYAKSLDPDFKIVPQNSPELYAWPKYMPAIDGLGMESLYYKPTDNPCSQAWCIENRNNAAAVRAAGKLVLTIDYANQAANIGDAYTRARAAGFVPYCSVQALNVMRVNQGWDP